MAIPTHWLHIYQKSKQGNGYLRRLQTYNYRHRINATGWFDTASCEVALSGKEAEIFLERMIGNRVAVIVDNPIEPVWEGMISRISFQDGTVVFTNSLDDMTNRVAITWSNAGATSISAYVGNTASQAIYGIKESVLQFNVDPNAGSGRRDTKRALHLAVRAYPLTSAVFNSGGGQRGLVKIEMRGFSQTLDWDHITSPSGTTPHGIISDCVTNNINGSTFFDDTDTSLIDTNGAWTLGAAPALTGLTRWQYIQAIQETGDGASRWIAGITPTDPNLGTRRFYYRKASPTVRYVVRQSDGMGIVRDTNGQRVHPWRVTPDGRIRLQDVLVGWDLPGDDPRVSYLAAIQYDAERQSVAWQSEDNVTFEGIFRLSSLYNPVESTTGVGRPPIRQSQ